jgi:hypothetical protein
VYGPLSTLPNASYYNPAKAGFYPSFAQHPPLRRYGDVRTFVATNEFSVWESQAPHAELLAALQALAPTLGTAPSLGKTTAPQQGTEGGALHLFPNHPNPFNPATTLSYRLAQAAQVRLVIYNVLGQPVRVLLEAPQQAGDHAVQWNGLDDYAQPVAAGLYFFHLRAGGRTAVRRMVLLK